MKKFKKKLKILNNEDKITDITKTEQKTESKNMKNKNIKWIVLLIVAFGMCIYQCVFNYTLKKELKSARTVYVYSLEEAMRGINASEKKKKFEEEALRLNEEVSAAEEKIKNFKDEKLKQDFTDVYLNSLRLKRDNLVEAYQKMLEDLSEKVNKGLEEIAEEKDANTIFLKSSVAVQTPLVVDVTPELVKKLKK